MNYEITLIESDEGWAVWCDALPGCCSQGATQEEAMAAIWVAMSEYLAAKSEVSPCDTSVDSVDVAEVRRVGGRSVR